MKFQYEIEIEMLKAKLAKAREWIVTEGECNMSAIPTDQEIRRVADRFAMRFDVDNSNFCEEMVTVLFGVLDTLQTLRRDKPEYAHKLINMSINSIYELMRDWSAK